MHPLILIGASGFGREALWVCRRAGLDVLGFCDDAVEKQTGHWEGLPLLGTLEAAASRLSQAGPLQVFHCAVGDNRARKTLTERARACGWMPATVIDPSALVAPDAVLTEGVFVGPLSVISCRARVGACALINQHAGVGHDSILGDYAQVCPGARVSGHCAVGPGATIGSNAVLLPNRRMGAWSVLGAGAVAVRDLEDGGSVVRVK
jgi:acetyltransferase EpsM